MCVFLCCGLQDFYKAASVRNPVVDMAGGLPLLGENVTFLFAISHPFSLLHFPLFLSPSGMRVTSDIPDWTYVECGVTFDPATPPNHEDVAKLLRHSPIVHAHKVRPEPEHQSGHTPIPCPIGQGNVFACMSSMYVVCGEMMRKLTIFQIYYV